MQPQILSQSSPFSTLLEEAGAKVKASGLGLITPWAPQQAILEHLISPPALTQD